MATRTALVARLVAGQDVLGLHSPFEPEVSARGCRYEAMVATLKDRGVLSRHLEWNVGLKLGSDQFKRLVLVYTIDGTSDGESRASIDAIGEEMKSLNKLRDLLAEASTVSLRQLLDGVAVSRPCAPPLRAPPPCRSQHADRPRDRTTAARLTYRRRPSRSSRLEPTLIWWRCSSTCTPRRATT